MCTDCSKSKGLPIATPIHYAYDENGESGTGDFTPNPEDPGNLPGLPKNWDPRFPKEPWWKWPLPDPIPLPKPCFMSMPEGCYALTLSKSSSSAQIYKSSYQMGTFRVATSGETEGVSMSGDTYRYNMIDLILGRIPTVTPPQIPIYPRNRYKSYWKVTKAGIPKYSYTKCKIHLTIEEYDYTQPPAGSFNGTFPAAASRTLDIYLSAATPPAGYPGPYFTGTVYVNGVLQINWNISLGWINSNVRRAKVLMHTMTGSIAPAPTGGEFFDTLYAKARWELTVEEGSNPAVPAGITATSCWSTANLHNVMTNLIDYPGINLDKEWTMHVLAVQAQLGCGRGVMFDQIGVPREGVATFSDDGYPDFDSANFGAAENQMQRNVPRAFLRSCSHEITHGFNQVHQEGEGGADNSIMTTTPSVANVLAAAGQVFPDDINIDFNNHVRHHLMHWPDVVLRPGGMTFGSGHGAAVIPSADHESDGMEHPDLELSVKSQHHRIKLGEPLYIEWKLSNQGNKAIQAPNTIAFENHFTSISIHKPNGQVMHYPNYVIYCDNTCIKNLDKGASIEGSTRLFWSSEGFAFETPGKHIVEINVSWEADGYQFSHSAQLEVLVDYPITENDNDIIHKMMTRQVGIFVALGGHAYHLKEAVEAIAYVKNKFKSHSVSTSLTPLISEKYLKISK